MASCYTEPSTLSAYIRDEDEEEKEPKSPQRSSSDESEESELEPLLTSAIQRRVSFADAFGLDLVSVKEFDNRVETAKGRGGEDYQLSCIFSVPASDEDLVLRLQQNKLELESIELLPGSTTIRGTVRVLNLSYHKVVYVHATLDGWQSHFDQLAEYVPGSSDGETDRFSFTHTLMPPFPPSGVKVEFCLRYESPAGIYWANNGGMNYVLFCHQKGGRALKEKEGEKERETEENNQKGKKSCLKAIKKGSCADLKPTDMSSELSEQESPRSVENKRGKTQQKAENQSKDTLEESCKTLAERRKRRPAAQLTHLQDYFAHRETGVQLVQPSRQEISKRDLNVVLPMPQQSIPVMTDTSGTFQVSCRKEQNGILPDHQIPLLPLDLCRSNVSPCSLHTNNSEIIGGTSSDVLGVQQTKNVSTELSNHAWKAGPNCTDNNALDQNCLLCFAASTASLPLNTEYNVSNTGDVILSMRNSQESAVTSVNGSHQRSSAMGNVELDPVKLSQALDPSTISDVLKYPEKTQIASQPHIDQESESICVQRRSGVSESPHDRHTLREKQSEDEAKPEKTAYAENATGLLNFKPVLLKECKSSTGFLDTEIKVKEETYRADEDTLTFNRIENKPFTDSSLERQHVHQIGDLKKKNEHIGKENKNASQIKQIPWSKYSEKDLMVLESRLQKDEEPSYLEDGYTEIWTSSRTSVMCNEGEPHKQAVCLDGGEEQAVCFELVEKGFSDSSENKNVADRKHDNDLKAGGQHTYEQQCESDDYKKLHKLQSSSETCSIEPNLRITSHTCSPSGHFSWTESAREDEVLLFTASHKDFKSKETVGCRVAQESQDQDVANEFPSSFSRTGTPSVCTMSSWLLVCWAKISSLSYITGALVCAILFVFFVTAYLHGLPVCLAAYLLSAYWWCRQDMEKHVATAESVD